MKKILCILALINFIFLASATDYKGTKTSDVSIGAGTHYITDNLIMTSGTKLTISQGVTLYVQGNIIINSGAEIYIETTPSNPTYLYFGYYNGGNWYKKSLIVYGRIDAIGCEDDPIVFDENPSYSGYGWNGIYLSQPSDSCHFRYCNIMNGEKTYTTSYSPGSVSECGGGVYVNQPSVIVRFYKCKFEDNEASAGGAILIKSDAGPYTNIEYCEFIDNYAYDGGAVYFYTSDEIWVELSMFYENEAVNEGGAIYYDNNSDDNMVMNCLFHNNDADYGGAIYNDDVTTSIYSCTIADNTASTYGSGIYYDNTNNEPIVKNTILYSNTSDQVYPDPDYNHGVYDYCCIQNISTWGTNINGNPQFVNPGGYDYRISKSYNSSCIDAGNSTHPHTTFDIRGESPYYRVVDEILFTAYDIDIGAFEYEDPAIDYKLKGTSNPEVISNFSFYPNPAIDYIFINFSSNFNQNLLINIYNINGQLVKSESLVLSENSYIEKLDFKDLKKGYYLIKMDFEIDEDIDFKIVIQ